MWDKIYTTQHYSQHYQKMGIHFTYKTDIGLGIQLKVHYTGLIGLRPVCFEYGRSYYPRNTHDWRNNCLTSQRHLKMLVADTKEVVKDIFPKSIRCTSKSLPYMIDRYYNSISKSLSYWFITPFSNLILNMQRWLTLTGSQIPKLKN